MYFLVADLLRIQGLPAWPAASTLLIRCIHALGGPKGLQHPDASVKQISVDLLGLIAAHLFRDAFSAADNQAWLAQLAPTEGECQTLLQTARLPDSAAVFRCLASSLQTF